MRQPPLPVTIIAWLLIVTGAVGFAFHLGDFRPGTAAILGSLAIEFVRVLAIVAGAFMLRGANWARWLAIAWIAFHVAISFYDGLRPVAFHTVILALFVYFVTRPNAARYFGNAAR